MKITQVKARIQRGEPDPHPVSDASQTLPGAGSVVVTVTTDEGVSGSGEVGFGRVIGAPESLGTLIEHVLKPLVLGTDPFFVRQTHEAMLRETEYHGSFGLAMFGIAAVDTALWDCLGKTLQVPCWKLWGAMRDKVPAYAMVAWINYSDDEVQRICMTALEQGFRAIKIKIGYPTLNQDIKRIEVIRKTVGDDVILMVDANQVLTTAEAIRRGRAFQDLGCYWWEEPIPADDVDGYAALADALDIPIATGENLYTPSDFARFLKHDAVDIVQPDMRRAGGPTTLLQIGTMANAFNIPYASHGGDAVQLNVMACLPNALYLETGGLDPSGPIKLVDGCMPIPQGPGFGWE